MNSMLRRGSAMSGWLSQTVPTRSLSQRLAFDQTLMLGLAATLVLALSGCGSTPVNHAPVEDRSVAQPAPVAVATPVKPPPGFENAGKPGYYAAKPGDTLIRIGLENGQSYKDIARWNGLDNPNKIEVGQVLRVVPPTGPDSAVVTRPVTSGSVTTTPIVVASASAKAASGPSSASSAPGNTGTAAQSASPAASAQSSSAAVQVATAAGVAAAVGSEDELAWIWPGKGAVVGEFNEPKNKGIDIGGIAGEAVVAAADGKVVYAGSGLRGYGNLVILKHNSTYLSAYAHNQTVLVKEDQIVKKGQKIAEMGNTDADRVKLHFEIRRQGKPVDPAKYLPAR